MRIFHRAQQPMACAISGAIRASLDTSPSNSARREPRRESGARHGPRAHGLVRAVRALQQQG